MQQVLGDETALENEVVEILSEALRCTRSWFKSALSQKLLKESHHHVMFTFNAELEVCQLLVIIIKIFYCSLIVQSECNGGHTLWLGKGARQKEAMQQLRCIPS